MYPRYLLRRIREALADTPVVFINGPRQAGKSTLARELAAEGRSSRYETLDNPGTLLSAQQDPIGFLGHSPSLMVIDEVQRAPGLYLPIKAEVDRKRQPARYLLTGSANAMLLPAVSEALVGRIEILTLLPLASSEIADAQVPLIDWLFDPDETFEGLLHSDGNPHMRFATGGFPEVQARSADRRAAWFENYTATLLQRDVADLSQIEGFTRLPDLLRLLATRSGGLVNTGDLGRTTDIPVTTLRRYLQLLRAVFAINFLPAWHNHRGKRLIKSPKIYIGDSGLLVHLLGLEEDSMGSDLGRIVETYCIQEIRKLIQWRTRRIGLYHYRTAGGTEVDLLLEAPNRQVVAIEIKSAETIHAKDFRGLLHLQEQLGDRFVRGVVFYMGDQVLSFGERLIALPIAGTLYIK